MSKGKTLLPKLRFPEFLDAVGWEETILEDVASFFKGKGISKADIVTNGRHPCIRYGELYTRYGEVISNVFSRTDVAAADLFFSRSNDVIIPASGETKLDIAKASCVMHDHVALGSDLNVIRTGNNGVFISYYFNGPKKLDIAKVAQGDTVAHLYPSQLGRLAIAIPGESEQQKVADCLSSIDELISARARKVVTLKTHKKGLMQQLFPREGETQPQLRFPEFREAPDWEGSSLGRTFETTSGGTPSRADTKYWDGGIPWITTSLVDFGVITKAEEFISEDGLNNSSAKLLPKGTVLIAMYGQGKTRGQVALLGVAAATNQACAAILPKPGINPYFVFLNLAGRYQEFRELSNSGGQENLSQGLIRDFPFAYPLDEEEQKRIANCLASLDEHITAATQELDTLNTHKKGLMQQLFPAAAEVVA